MIEDSINNINEFASMKLCAECMEPIKDNAYLCDDCLRVVSNG